MATGARPRLKKAEPTNWKKIVKKRLREQGKEYTNEKGKLFPAKDVKKPGCGKTCPYKCTIYISEFHRKQIHNSFWIMDDNEKRSFYSKFIVKKIFKGNGPPLKFPEEKIHSNTFSKSEEPGFRYARVSF